MKSRRLYRYQDSLRHTNLSNKKTMSDYSNILKIIEKSDTIEYDFWKSIHALEEALTRERNKTTRLSRTRQKLNRDGVIETLRSLAIRKKPGDGFEMLMKRDMPELTAEAVVLRHSSRFEDDVVEAAKQRLVEHGVDLKKLQIKKPIKSV